MDKEFGQPRTGSFRAVVRAGAKETAYRRVGAGRPVVVVSERFDDDPLLAPVVERLAARFRVVVPLVGEGRDDFSAWLRSFLDGIGLPEVSVVADADFGAPARTFAAMEPDRVAALVVLSPDGTDRVSEIEGTRLLSVRIDRDPAELAVLIERFLADGADC